MLKKAIYWILARLRGRINIAKLKKQGLIIGHNGGIPHGLIIDPHQCWLITIGDNVVMAPNVHILAHDASTKAHLGFTRIGKVKIGNKVFLGAGTIVLPGVTIGENSIVGAGSVVTRDIPPNVVAAGSPAKVICELEDYLDKHRALMSSHPCFGEEYTVEKNVSRAMKEEMIELMVGNVGYVK